MQTVNMHVLFESAWVYEQIDFSSNLFSAVKEQSTFYDATSRSSTPQRPEDLLNDIASSGMSPSDSPLSPSTLAKVVACKFDSYQQEQEHLEERLLQYTNGSCVPFIPRFV